jgi:hypothetical protein
VEPAQPDARTVDAFSDAHTTEELPRPRPPSTTARLEPSGPRQHDAQRTGVFTTPVLGSLAFDARARDSGPVHDDGDDFPTVVTERSNPSVQSLSGNRLNGGLVPGTECVVPNAEHIESTFPAHSAHRSGRGRWLLLVGTAAAGLLMPLLGGILIYRFASSDSARESAEVVAIPSTETQPPAPLESPSAPSPSASAQATPAVEETPEAATAAEAAAETKTTAKTARRSARSTPTRGLTSSAAMRPLIAPRVPSANQRALAASKPVETSEPPQRQNDYGF